MEGARPKRIGWVAVAIVLWAFVTFAGLVLTEDFLGAYLDPTFSGLWQIAFVLLSALAMGILLHLRERRMGRERAE